MKTKKIINLFLSILFLTAPLISKAQGWDPGALTATGLPGGSITAIIFGLLQWTLRIFGFIAVIGFVISGAMYILSAGNEDTMQTAKKAMTYSIIGVVVALSGLVIIYAINSILWATPF
jgi:hypothetical protein